MAANMFIKGQNIVTKNIKYQHSKVLEESCV